MRAVFVAAKEHKERKRWGEAPDKPFSITFQGKPSLRLRQDIDVAGLKFGELPKYFRHQRMLKNIHRAKCLQQVS